MMSYRSYRRCARYRVLFYRSYRSDRYRCQCCIDTGTNSGTDGHTGGTGIDVVPNLPKCPVPVLMSYRTYRSVRYRYYRRYASVRTVPNTPLQGTAVVYHPHQPYIFNLQPPSPLPVGHTSNFGKFNIVVVPADRRQQEGQRTDSSSHGGVHIYSTCFVFTLNRSFYPTASVVPPLSFLILHAREIQILWSKQ